MKNGLLLFLAIAITIIGLYFGWLNHNRETGGTAKPPPVLDLITNPSIGIFKNSTEPTDSPKSLVTDKDRVQLSTLNSVLESRNDNDQRLDKDLKVLSAGAKQLLRQRYEEFPPEGRNERGTIVFLLGRNLTEKSDIEFMEQVLSEPPCRSMQNCKEDSPRGQGADAHSETGLEVSLNYPQIVALKSLERILEAGESDPLYQYALEEILRARQSPISKVAELARDIEAKYSKAR